MGLHPISTHLAKQVLNDPPVAQVGNRILSCLSDFRVSSELGTPEIPGREMAEVCGNPQPIQQSLLHTLFPSINILVWSIALLCHAACKNFAGLFAVRAILGACEGSITAGFLIISSMFYTRTEQTLRIGYWCKSTLCFPRRQALIEHSTVLMNGTGENNCDDST